MHFFANINCVVYDSVSYFLTMSFLCVFIRHDMG